MRILNLIGFIFLFIISIPTAYCENFTIVPINKNHKQQMTSLKTWTEGCPVILDRLRVVKFSYYDFDGKEHQNGEIVVLDAVSERVLSIFKELHNIKFPIAKAYPIEHYDGNDEKSMLDNNSSSYN